MAESPPRIWTVFGVLSLGLSVQLGVGMFAALIWLLFNSTVDMSSEAWVGEMMKNPSMFAFMLIGAQLGLLGILLAALYFSPASWRERTRWSWGGASWKWLPLWCLATVGSGVLGDKIIDSGASEYAQQQMEILSTQPWTYGVFIIIVGSVLPGIIEELIFRGYVQVRFLKRWSALTAVALSSLFFALFHWDPVYIILVFPIGCWLGFLAYRLGGIIPGVCCHVFHNMTAFSLLVFYPAANTEHEPAWFAVGLEVLLILCLVAAIFLLLRMPAHDQVSA